MKQTSLVNMLLVFAAAIGALLLFSGTVVAQTTSVTPGNEDPLATAIESPILWFDSSRQGATPSEEKAYWSFQ